MLSNFGLGFISSQAQTTTFLKSFSYRQTPSFNHAVSRPAPFNDITEQTINENN